MRRLARSPAVCCALHIGVVVQPLQHRRFKPQAPRLSQGGADAPFSARSLGPQ